MIKPLTRTTPGGEDSYTSTHNMEPPFKIEIDPIDDGLRLNH